MNLPIKNEWLADLLADKRDLITECWIEDIRSEGISGYNAITDEQLRKELPPTVDSMMDALRTGDKDGPRKHSIGIIKRRLEDGFQLSDIQMSLHSLETAVMRVVKGANLGSVREFEALQTASNMYYTVALIAAAVYEQLRIEQQRRFVATYEFGLTLSRNLDLDDMLDTAVHKVAEHINGESVAILLAGAEGRQDEVRACHNLDEDLVKALSGICESLGCGLVNMDNLDMHETICEVPDVRIYELLHPWSELLATHGRLSIVCTPLVAKQRYLGSMIILWSEVHSSSIIEKDFLLAMAGHTANAVQNAILFEEAKGKRELGVLLDASKLFVSSLDTKDIVRKIARMAAEAVRADFAIVFTQDHLPKYSYIAFYVRNRNAAKTARRVVEVVSSEWEETGFNSLGSDFANGKAMLYRNQTEFPEQMRSLAGIGESGMVVPLRQKDVLFGALALVSLAPNVFTEDDLVLATGLADLAAVAIENARLYEYERNIAETLQRSFLPSSLPDIEDYEIAAYYRPAMAEAEVGGDFYDVFTIGENNISIIIGDVSGKGLKAAIPTAMGKYMMRAYAAENPLPNNVLTRFNRTFYENAPEGQFMTALYGILNPKDNTITYVNAGHNPPLLYSSESGQTIETSIGGMSIGIIIDAEYTEKKIQMQPGDVLLLYTDGATDIKVNGDRLNVEGLMQLFSLSIHKSAEQIVNDISDGIWDYSHGRLPDDVALVVLKRLGNKHDKDKILAK